MRPSWPDGLASLLVELSWLNRLRWLAGLLVLVLGVAAATWDGIGWSDVSGEIIGLGIAIISYNAVFWAICRYRSGWLSQWSAMLMVAGIGLYGTFTGLAASWFVSAGDEEDDARFDRVEEELRAVRGALERLAPPDDAISEERREEPDAPGGEE